MVTVRVKMVPAGASGASVGCGVGALDGATVGATVGAEVGAGVGQACVPQMRCDSEGQSRPPCAALR